MIFIDYNDKRPLYEQIMEKIQTLILNGVLEPDEKIPSVRALAMELSINPNTIQRAYSELEREGYIYSVKGRGNFVKKDENLLQLNREKTLRNFREEVGVLKNKGITLEEALICVRQVYDVSDREKEGKE
ncbi:MAG: GntR family transcriptional regulator [Eubacterium sp.]|nr:GntR family transcriptional regulator [Eubacterium sp.]MDD7210113.1 GntR family transcriptional regulator [Lachnospiraceae bacterium]MDY5496513.1 GntR family transcriptional regulator [Anaerobutyricum sp.]